MWSAALGTPVDPDVKSATAMSLAPGRRGADRHGRPGVEDVEQALDALVRRGRGLRATRAAGMSAAAMTSTGVHLVERGRHLGAAQPVVQRRGHGPEPPARPVEKERRGAVGQLPGHDVAAPDPVAASRPARPPMAASTAPASSGPSRRRAPIRRPDPAYPIRRHPIRRHR